MERIEIARSATKKDETYYYNSSKRQREITNGYKYLIASPLYTNILLIQFIILIPVYKLMYLNHFLAYITELLVA